MVHAAAAGAHSDDRTLAALFGAAAVLQVAWAAGAAVRPGAGAAACGLTLHVGSIGIWATSRTVGIGAVDGLAGGQPVALQDATVVAFEAVVALAIGYALLGRVPTASRSKPVALILGVVAVAAAVPAMTIPHEHDHTGGQAGIDPVAARGLIETTEHAHALLTGGDNDEAVDASLDPDVQLGAAGLPRLPELRGVTRKHREAAADLILATNAVLAGFTDVAAAQAAGYRSVGDGFTGHEHFVNHAYLDDHAILDPGRVESLVYRVEPDGSRELVSGMYILPPDRTMADVPDVAGPYTVWHDHQNLCWHPDGRLAGVLVDGECHPGGTFRATPPMLHVWIVEHPCGPFAGIEGSHGSGCVHDHDA